jgi:hypothetical protein
MEITTRRRHALATALALVLAIESVSAVAAAAVTTRVPAGGAADVAPVAAVEAGSVVRTSPAGAGIDAARAVAVVAARRAPESPTSPKVGAARTLVSPASARVVRTLPLALAPAKAPKAASGSGGGASSGPVSYKGRNHVWIPALGINRSVAWFPCSREREPDNYVYRWGCAGRNNIYLMGHAYSVFKPLHDAYVSGRLRKGMKAVYADGNGKVHTYTVRWWKLTRPTTAASWAWAAQSVPSMTLQTCVGKNSEYRLMVRLVEVGG